jgi:hypothetical protein
MRKKNNMVILLVFFENDGGVSSIIISGIQVIAKVKYGFSSSFVHDCSGLCVMFL